VSALSILLLIAVTVGLVCWLARWNERVEAEAKAARAAIPDPYDQGEAAAKAGEPFWANPYCIPSGGRNAHDRWQAGWSFGMQQRSGMAPTRPTLRAVGRAED
jgi:hypothetical protein